MIQAERQVQSQQRPRGGKLDARWPPGIAVRLIGPTRGCTQKQVLAAVEAIRKYGDSLAISWDGDSLRHGSFTEVLVPFIRESREQAKGVVLLPRCRPKDSGVHTTRGLLEAGHVPRSVPISVAEERGAQALLDRRLGRHWRDSFQGDMRDYMALAAANRVISAPRAVIWLYDDDRELERYGRWACLAEYLAFCHWHSGESASYHVIDKSGRVLKAEDLSKSPWWSMGPEAFGWRRSGGGDGKRGVGVRNGGCIIS